MRTIVTLFLLCCSLKAAEIVKQRTIVRSVDGKVKIDAQAKAGDTVILFNESPNVKSWRLIHDGTKVLNLFESEGFTWTINSLFCGTEVECKTEIKRLKLVDLPPPEDPPVTE